MKFRITTLLLLLTGISLFSCKKSDIPQLSAASFNFVNAVPGSAPMITRFAGQNFYYSKITSSNQVPFGASNVFSHEAGNTTFTLVQSTDTTHTLYQGNFSLQANNSYTFFLAGTTAQPDTLFVHEQLPVYASTDSVAGIRFVNLSPGSNPVSVDIQGQANGSEVNSLSYKGITTFKQYTANHTVSSYVFEFRDAAAGNLLASYTLNGVNNGIGTNTIANKVRFKNLTIALIGQPAGGTVSQQCILVNNF